MDINLLTATAERLKTLPYQTIKNTIRGLLQQNG